MLDSAYTPIGGSQIATFHTLPSLTMIVDAAGKIPSFALTPTPDFDALVGAPAGGLVAYVAGGAIYAAKTK